MTILGIIDIGTDSVIYYSQLDEAAFFGQLDKISCVVGYTPTSIRISIKKVDEYGLRELLACCYRYKVKMKQLAVFDREEFSAWLRNKEAYWYESIFSKETTTNEVIDIVSAPSIKGKWD